jgi:hypothetical protein
MLLNSKGEPTEPERPSNDAVLKIIHEQVAEQQSSDLADQVAQAGEENERVKKGNAEAKRAIQIVMDILDHNARVIEEKVKGGGLPTMEMYKATDLSKCLRQTQAYLEALITPTNQSN